MSSASAEPDVAADDDAGNWGVGIIGQMSTRPILGTYGREASSTGSVSSGCCTVTDVKTHVILSDSAKLNMVLESGLEIQDVEVVADVVRSNQNLTATIASGSYQSDGVVIAPRFRKTLSGVANSYANNLIVRAAGVVLKERRRRVLVSRETTLHVRFARLPREAAQMGAVIAAPMPAFYNTSVSVDDIIAHSVGQLLDLFGIDTGPVKRWQGAKLRPKTGQA